MPEVTKGSVDFCSRYDDISFVRPSADDPIPMPPGDQSSKKPSSQMHVNHDEPVSQSRHLLSYSRWCSTLVPEVLKTRTPFGAFLARTIQLSKCLSSDLAPTFFPLPIPPGYWHEMPANAGAHRRRSIHRSRALHVIVMALNFWHSGGVFVDDHLLQRAPNRLHTTLYKRIRALLKSDGPSSAFQATKAGRRFPELIARIGELSEVLTCNGCSASPYSKSFTGVEVPKDDSVMPELRPYTDLNPDRLTLSGKGKFDATTFLSDPLVMPYRDPAVLALPGPAGIRPKIRDLPTTVGKLAELWDRQGLLLIHNKQIDPDRYVRVFNAYKSTELDRQIGDRRGANSLEARISDFGPSCCLPSGSDISELSLDPRKQKLSICITDRRDFYHQFWITKRKALVNTVGPGLPCDLVSECSSFSLFALESSRKSYRRESHGDMLHGASLDPVLPSGTCHIAFQSILQGDHCGVDIATDAHTSLLQRHGLLQQDSMLIATSPLRHPSLCQGLVIDDYFTISVEDGETDKTKSRAFQLYAESQKVYEKHQLEGSPHKDILGDEVGRVIGAWVNTSAEARSRGLATISAPPQKRLGLSHVSLEVAKMPATSDALHLCLIGGWVSVMGYRRQMYSLFDQAYKVVDTKTFDANSPKVVPLSRKVANELVLAAVLHPLMMTDLGCRYHDRLFATDASSKKGAICSCPISPTISEVLWKTSKSKGSYTRLLTPADELLLRLGIKEEEERVDAHGFFDASPQRPLAYRFDFLEVFAGAAKITAAVHRLGIPVGPPIELSFSPEYDVKNNHVLSWITYLVSERLILAIMLEPPCTTFSIIRRPALRSKTQPYGFQPHEEKTQTGNSLACRSCQVMVVAAHNRVAAMLETPFTSLLKHLPAWRVVAGLPCSTVARVDSCRFGSPHLKSFRMLCVHARPENINRRCQCTTKHLQVQGKYTKASATYTDALAEAIAIDLCRWVSQEREVLLEESKVVSKGLESLVINDLAVSGDWKVESSWSFRKESHINILEEAALLRLAQRCVGLRYPTRITAMVDSNVVRGASSKGRSSSIGLSTVLRKLNALCVAGALYINIPFCPTRHNVADDPTRDHELRQPTPGFGIQELTREQLFDLCGLPKLRRWAANWARLILRLGGLHLIYLRRRDIYRRSLLDFGPTETMDFDATLGFPGEGPSDFLFLPCPLGCLWISLVVWVYLVYLPRSNRCFACCVFLWLSCLPVSSSLPGAAMAMPISPGTPAEVRKSLQRRTAEPLVEGRPVLPATGSAREKYLNIFYAWAEGEGIDVLHLLEHPSTYVEEINVILCKFGRTLYGAGKTYTQYAETINGITSIRPSLRRQMQGAWDLGFAWMRQEPSQHHVAMPSIILLSMITTALMWGWTYFAGSLAIGWGSLLRPGEIFSLKRYNLLFPSDSGFSIQYLLVSLQEPKTRFTTARHQATRLDIPDLLQVVTMIYEKMPPHHSIWPYSPQTFRNRFRSVLSALKLPIEHSATLKALDPGSLRAGGATWLMQVTDNGELVRRRGRWQNHRIMEVYIQEVSSLLYLQKITATSRDTIFATASVFNSVLERAGSFISSAIPTNVWFILFSS